MSTLKKVEGGEIWEKGDDETRRQERARRRRVREREGGNTPD
jgi:hypothetical protein